MPKAQIIKIAGYTVEFTSTGAPQSDNYSDRPIMTAKELDRIFTRAQYLRNAPKPFTHVDGENLEVSFQENGSVTIGCQSIDFKTLAKAHQLSLNARKK